MRNLRKFIHSFVFDPPLSAEEISSFRDSKEPWESLAYVVHLASLGDFSAMARIEPLIRANRDVLFWGVAAKFAGMAGSWGLVESMAENFRAEPEYAQEYMADMMMYSCNPAFTGRLVELYEAAEDDEIRGSMAWGLSFLLEPESGFICIGARESDKYGDDLDDEEGEMPDFANMSPKELFAKKRDYAGYREVIQGALEGLSASGVRAGDAVLEGALLDARQLALRIAKRFASSNDTRDRIIEELVFLSAMTGVDFSPVMRPSSGVNSLEACALIEDLLEDPILDAMLPGRRYFLGHPIPA